MQRVRALRVATSPCATVFSVHYEKPGDRYVTLLFDARTAGCAFFSSHGERAERLPLSSPPCAPVPTADRCTVYQEQQEQRQRQK